MDCVSTLLLGYEKRILRPVNQLGWGASELCGDRGVSEEGDPTVSDCLFPKGDRAVGVRNGK